MGITIRRALPEDSYDFTICHISIWQSAYKGILPDEYLSNMSNEVEQSLNEKPEPGTITTEFLNKDNRSEFLVFPYISTQMLRKVRFYSILLRISPIFLLY